MIIRPATPDDYNAICALVTTPEELFLFNPAGSYPFTRAQLEQLALERFALTVVEEAGEILGFANLYNHQAGEHTFIGNVLIHPQHRGRGLGRILVRRMLEIAIREYRLPEVRLSVFSENTLALLLYSRMGFIPYAVEQREDHHRRPVALIHMRLLTQEWDSAHQAEPLE